MRFTCGHHIIIRLILLKHQPGRHHVIPCESPIASGVQVPQAQSLFEPDFYLCNATRDFSGYEILGATWRLVVEKNPVNGVETVCLAVVYSDPVAKQFGHSVRRARMEWCRFVVSTTPCGSEQFRCRGLVKT